MTNFYQKDTIVARCTPHGESALALIRLSGDDTYRILRKVFLSKHHDISDKKAIHKMQILGDIVDFDSNETFDNVAVVFSNAPHSYTGEDALEISCHGNMVVVARIIRMCILCGARLAEPGEFTKRSFLNGKIDLAQAESVCELIRGKTETAYKFALRNLKGDLSNFIAKARENIISSLAEIEARLDFPEDDIALMKDDGIMSMLTDSRKMASDLINNSTKGRIFRDGAKVVIAGKPNSGKSSLLNTLSGLERAIVTPHPGTTRDVVEATLEIEGIPVTFLDTAGVHKSPEAIEAIGIEKAIGEIKNADLVLFVADSASLFDENDTLVYQEIKQNKHIVVLNKTDIPKSESCLTSDDLRKKLNIENVIEISALTRIGIRELEVEIKNALLGDNGRECGFDEESVLIANIRHIESLKKTCSALNEAIDGIKLHRQPELVAIDLRAALAPLDSILGLNADEEILNKIFESFCIGK